MLFYRFPLHYFDGVKRNRQFIPPAVTLREHHWSHYEALAVAQFEMQEMFYVHGGSS